MSNLIVQENAASLCYNLDLIPNTYLVAITQRNVAIVEAMIRNDSAYIRSNQANASIQYKRGKVHSTKPTWKERVAEDAPNIKYGGSTAFWMDKLKNYLLFNNSDPLYAYEDVMYYTVSAIDRENSTHLNADGVGREEITERLLSIDKADLLVFLKTPNTSTNSYKLISIISKTTNPTHSDYKPRINYSFATKFCHYACFYLFDGVPEQDNFSIFDNVLEKALLKYIKKYHLNYTVVDFKKYDKYLEAIEAVIRESKRNGHGNEVSKNGLDHLLWYYYKGRI